MTRLLLFLILFSWVTAQEKERWQRIYTFEDSTVDIDVSKVIFGTDYTGRVRFRITLSRPEPMPGTKGAKYKSVIETIEFRCPDRLYRIFEVIRFDSKGNPFKSERTEPAVEWNEIKSSSIMHKLFTSGCELIAEKRKNP